MRISSISVTTAIASAFLSYSTNAFSPVANTNVLSSSRVRSSKHDLSFLRMSKEEDGDDTREDGSGEIGKFREGLSITRSGLKTNGEVSYI